MEKKYSIAIDGPSGAGKSTVARSIAGKYGFVYVDTGAIYRTVALACIRKNVNLKDEDEISALFPEIHIEIKYDSNNVQRMYLNGQDVSSNIRTPDVSLGASDVSSVPACRAFLLDMQRKFSEEYNVIMDGRDIGTVVLPDADLKFYLTASSEERARRRYLELQEKGTTQSFDEVLKDIEYRDYQDTHREIAPLRQADDAVVVDCSNLNFEETLSELCSIIEEKLGVLPK